MYKVFYFNPLRVCNYVLYNGSGECVIVDPGAGSDAERARLEGFIDKQGLSVKAILLTHGHFDHVLSLRQAAAKWQVPVYMHPADSGVFAAAAHICPAFGMQYEPYEGEILDIRNCTGSLPEGLRFEVIPTPGHTPGGVCLYLESDGLLLSGYTLFCGGVGRTDHPGGNFDQLLGSIKSGILTLPPQTDVLPGHGYATTIEDEIAANPFLQ